MNYKILNPGGNKTALVFGSDYTIDEKKQINDKILRENLDVEQVGFLDVENKKLEMAGGEFCVNATRCAIWEYLSGQEGSLEISVSGTSEKISGGITANKEVYAKIKIKRKIEDIAQIKEDYTIMNLDGIKLLVISEEKSKKYIDDLKENECNSKKVLKQMMIDSNIDEKAIGVILLEKYEESLKIYPIIWVKSIDTLYYETACGSGSLSAAIYKYIENKTTTLSILQPSGYTIKVFLNVKDNYLESGIIQGIVEG